MTERADKIINQIIISIMIFFPVGLPFMAIGTCIEHALDNTEEIVDYDKYLDPRSGLQPPFDGISPYANIADYFKIFGVFTSVTTINALFLGGVIFSTLKILNKLSSIKIQDFVTITNAEFCAYVGTLTSLVISITALCISYIYRNATETQKNETKKNQSQALLNRDIEVKEDIKDNDNNSNKSTDYKYRRSNNILKPHKIKSESAVRSDVRREVLQDLSFITPLSIINPISNVISKFKNHEI